jgi:hypothetical protein
MKILREKQRRNANIVFANHLIQIFYENITIKFFNENFMFSVVKFHILKFPPKKCTHPFLSAFSVFSLQSVFSTRLILEFFLSYCRGNC